MNYDRNPITIHTNSVSIFFLNKNLRYGRRSRYVFIAKNMSYRKNSHSLYLSLNRILIIMHLLEGRKCFEPIEV